MLPSTRQHTCSTNGPCRSTSLANALSSFAEMKRSSKPASVHSSGSGRMTNRRMYRSKVSGLAAMMAALVGRAKKTVRRSLYIAHMYTKPHTDFREPAELNPEIVKAGKGSVAIWLVARLVTAVYHG